MVLGVFDPLVGFHAGLAEGLRALHAVAGGQGVVLAAGAALGGEGTLSSGDTTGLAQPAGEGGGEARFTLIKD